MELAKFKKVKKPNLSLAEKVLLNLKKSARMKAEEEYSKSEAKSKKQIEKELPFFSSKYNDHRLPRHRDL